MFKSYLFAEAYLAAQEIRPPKDGPQGVIFSGVLGEAGLDLLKEQRRRNGGKGC